MAYVDATAMAFFLFSHNSKKLHHNIHIEKKKWVYRKRRNEGERERTCKNGAAMQSGVVEDIFIVIKY